MKKIILLLICSLTLSGLYAQKTVQGIVTGEGEALPGVNVLLKGTERGVVTNIDGSYSIEVPGEDAVLQFSYIGFQPKEVVVGNQSQIDVILETDLLSLQEVIVVGYGTTTKKEATGAVTAVNAERIESLNPQRVDQALQGQVAGVNINAASGSPGGSFNIRIRGITTNGNNNPLILVDGVRYDAAGLNALNPNDVESINVLKDATAGIYGVQAANGVIMITTKKGKLNTKPKLNFSGYYGVQETSNKLNLLNAREYAILKNEAFAAGNQTPPFNNVELGEGTDWQNQVFQTAPIQNYNLTISGGSDKTSYSFGGSYLDQEGIVGGPQASFRRLNARLNFVTELAPRVKLENVLLYTNEQRKTLPEFSIGSVLYNAINAYPTEGVFQQDGSYSYLEQVNDVINPVAQMANTFNDNVTNKIVGKQEITYDIDDNFTVTGRAGYNYAIYDGKFFSPLIYYGPGKAQNTALDANLTPVDVNIIEDINIPRLSSVTETRQTFLDYNFEAFVNYQKVFNQAHNFKATLGASLFGILNSAVDGTAFDIPYNSWDFADISAADQNNLLNNSNSWQDRSRLLS
ncbi:MAG: SusC/RagA family TonB-linked outer membrane protein, partial [Cyclobacteriaceae bacterium]